jgi:hypothetical protein
MPNPQPARLPRLRAMNLKVPDRSRVVTFAEELEETHKVGPRA